MEAAMGDPSSPSNYKDFAVSGKIMLSAIIILLFVVILIIFLHLYARWYVLRARRRGNLHSNRRRNRFVFFVESDNNNAPPSNHTPSNPGLDAEILKSLPVFVFGSKTDSDSDSDPIECAVCLSEFEENEKGRKLPSCSHCFHIDCIDMWFHSHSTCPLCRSPVEPLPVSQSVVDVEPEMMEPGSSSTGSTSFRARRKPVELAGVSIEIPRRFDAEFAVAGTGFSPSTSTPLTPSFKSPISRVMSLSFKRIIGRDRRGGCSPSGAGSSAIEPDIERGKSVL